MKHELSPCGHKFRPQPEGHQIKQAAQLSLTFRVDGGGQRLDLFLAGRLVKEGLTRSRIQLLVRSGIVLVNGLRVKAKHVLRSGDLIELTLSGQDDSVPELVAEPVSFVILFEDDDLIVLIKPPGLVVHPGAGHGSATLAHGLLHHCGHLSEINGASRPGIVHRLDKDTSGIMVAAKNDSSHRDLARQFKGREVRKTYLAIADGRLSSDAGRIEAPIGRHPVYRKKMTVRDDGREAVTNWRVLDRFPQGLILLELGLETGRTHQIRVHLAAMGCPIAGDMLYGREKSLYAQLGIGRQCLHACKLVFRHPRTGEAMSFSAPAWPDMQGTLALLGGKTNGG